MSQSSACFRSWLTPPRTALRVPIDARPSLAAVAARGCGGRCGGWRATSRRRREGKRRPARGASRSQAASLRCVAFVLQDAS